MCCHRTCSSMMYEGNRRSDSPGDFFRQRHPRRCDGRWLPPKGHHLLTSSGHRKNGRRLRRGRTLETGPVDLVAGLLGRKPAVRTFWGRAVIDDGVDLASDRHGKAILLGELHDAARGLDALSDLIHRRHDLVHRLARAELLADIPVATALAGARDDEIADTGQPGEGVPVTARRLAHLGHLTHR